MKHILSIDTGAKAIIVSDSRRSCINDNKTFIPMLEETLHEVDVRNVTADKGYDSEVNHKFAHRNAGVNFIIPLRYEVSLDRTTGFYHRKLKRNSPLRSIINEAR